jgi:hypothetical protein
MAYNAIKITDYRIVHVTKRIHFVVLDMPNETYLLSQNGGNDLLNITYRYSNVVFRGSKQQCVEWLASRIERE